MFDRLEGFVNKWINDISPWTNVYSLSRSLIAFASLLTLVFNDASILFRPVAGIDYYPLCENNKLSLYCLSSNSYLALNIEKTIAIFILVLVVIGWRPRITGLLHWWVSFSLQSSAVTLDGGAQVATVITLLLIPVTLCDKRKNHWGFKKNLEINSKKDQLSKVVALCFLVAIRLQLSIIYINAAIARTKNPEWLDGTALYYYLNDPMLGLPDILLHFINPILLSPLVVIPTWGTEILELLLFSAIFMPKKFWKYILLLGILFHTIIAVMMGLISFSLIMIASLILYLRPIEESFDFSKITKVLTLSIFKKNSSNLIPNASDTSTGE